MVAPNLQASGTLAAVTSGNLTVTLPTHQTDDILVVVLMAWLPNSTGTAVTAAPADWTKVDTVTQIATTIDAEYAIFWRRATTAGTTAPAFVRPTGWDTGTDGVWAGRAYVIRDCIKTGDPWDAVTKSGPHTAANQAFPAVSVLDTERTVIQFLSKADNNGAVTAASGWTLDTAATSTTGTDSSFQTIRKDNVSTSTTADTATITASANAGSAYAFFGVSFKPIPPAVIAGVESVSTTTSDSAQLTVYTPDPPTTIAPVESVSVTVSDTAQFVSPGTPTAPLSLSATTGSNGAVNLTWTAPAGTQ